MKKKVLLIIIIKGFQNILNKEEKDIQKTYDFETEFIDNNKKIKDCKVGESYTVILYEDGTVWVAGTNSYHEWDEIKDGIELDKFTKLNIESISEIAVGDNFALALTENGEVYSWGGNEYGQLGREVSTMHKKDDVPRKLKLKGIKKIQAKGCQAVALSDDDTAYYWGYATESSRDESKILELEGYRISEIFLTGSEYFFKTTYGEIIGVGFDFDAITNQKNGWAREPIELNMNKVQLIKSRDNLSNMLIKEDGTAYVLDTYETGKLIPIKTSVKVKDIFYVGEQTDNQEGKGYFILDMDNDLYYNEKCIIKDVKEVACYEDKIFLVLKEDGTVYNLGYLIEEQVIEGVSTHKFYKEPVQLNVAKIKSIMIRSGFTILIDSKNRIYKYGRSDKGSLGIPNNEKIEEFELVKE